MDTLFVFWDSVRIGTLEPIGRGAAFSYDEAYLSSREARPISLSLPLRAESFTGPEAMAWFANLLPEGEVRSHVARELGVSERNDFALLSAIGGDCAGALRVIPESSPGRDEEKLDPLPWEDLEERIVSTPRPSLLALMMADGPLRLSLAGAQDKLPVHYRDGNLALPAGGAASTHLLKISSGGIPDLVQNEFLCLALAREVGLPVCRASIGPTKTPILLVERYDRHVGDDRAAIRLHQEDFCQALGLGPDTKYENEGGPAIADMFDVLEQSSRNPLADKRRFLRLVLFNHLIGNADAHAKNVSLLYGRFGDRAGPRLAPFYDLVCTRAYDGLDRKNAQKIGGEFRPERVQRRHWERLAEAVGVKPRYLMGLGDELARQLAEVSGPAAETIGKAHGGAETLGRIVDVIHRRAERMLGQFGDP